MPQKKKAINMETKSSKPLRQTILFDSLARSSPARPSRSTPTARTKRKHISDPEESSSDHISSIKLQPATPRKALSNFNHSDSPRPARTKRIRKVIVDSESEQEQAQPTSDKSDSDVVIVRQPRRRRLTTKNSESPEDEPSSPTVPAESDDRLFNTGDDIELSSDDEVDKDKILDSKFRVRNKQTVFQKNLERFRRKKQGRPMSSSESEAESNHTESGSGRDQPFRGARPVSSVADDLSEERSDTSSESDFIVEDDNPDVAQLPTEFSMRSHEDISHQFKIIFQFFVHIAVRPPTERRLFMEAQLREQEYFSFPLKVTRRKLSGLRDSLVASSIWRPEFKALLEKYPHLDLVPLDFAVPSCDACHLGGRMSTLLGRLGGVPYDGMGFIEQVSRAYNVDSDSGSDGEVAEHYSKTKSGFFEFHFGRFCARRVQVYHQFTHWEHHLFNAIRSEVDDLRAVEQSRGFVRIAFAGGRKPPDDLTDADGVCEWLDERGLVDQEWQKLRAMMDNAHHLEVSARRGEQD